MRKSAWILALLLAGCSEGAPGRQGTPGAVCTATFGGDGSLSVTCPDGSSSTLPPGSCEEIADASGTRTIRCPDGTEAVIQPGDVLAEGVVVGRVRLMPSRAGAAGARVEVVGTDRFATCAADGSFRVEGIPPGAWAIRVTHDRWQPVELDPIPLVGTWNVGEIELHRGRELGGLVSIDEQTGSLIVRKDGSLFAFRASDGSMTELPARVDEAWWVDAETVALARWNGPVTSLGLWQLDTGAVTWAAGFDGYDFTSGGILGTKYLEGNQKQLVWISRAGETDLGTLTDGWWSLYADKTMFHAVGAEGLFFFDARATPQMRQLDARRPSNVQSDGGELVLATFTDETLLFDLDGDSFAAPSYTWIWAGLAVWHESDNTYHAYDARTDLLRTLPPGTPFTWRGPDNRWFFTATDGVWSVEPRGGGTAIEIGSTVPEETSPSGDRAIWYDDDTAGFQVRDLVTGAAIETPELDVDPDGFDWLWFFDDDAIAFSFDLELHLITLDGARYQLGSLVGEGIDLHIANGHVLVVDGEAGRVVELATGQTARLGQVRDARFTPDGSRVVWLSGGYRLRSLDLATGAIETLAGQAEEYFLFDTGALVLSDDPMSGDAQPTFLPWL